MTNSMQDDLSSSASPKLNKDEEMGDVITDHKTAVSQSNYFLTFSLQGYVVFLLRGGLVLTSDGGGSVPCFACKGLVVYS